MLRRLFIFLFYCLFALIIIGVCLVLLFPKDRFLSWTGDFIESKNPGFTCTIGDIRYVHPLKIRFYQVLIKNELRQFELPVDSLLLSIEPRYPVDNVEVIGVLFGGHLSFNVNLEKKDQFDFENLTLSQLRLRDITMLQRTIDRPLEGIISFTGRAVTARKNLSKVRFNGNVQIDRFSTELRKPVLNETQVHFDSVEADVTFSRNILDLSNGKASGILMAGDFSGQIKRWDPWRKSEIDIDGNLMPQPELLKKHPNLVDPLRQLFQKYGRKSIPYIIDGTIKEPQFQFGTPN